MSVSNKGEFIVKAKIDRKSISGARIFPTTYSTSDTRTMADAHVVRLTPPFWCPSEFDKHRSYSRLRCCEGAWRLPHCRHNISS